MHPSTHQYLRPTDAQLDTMETAREAAKAYTDAIERLVPDGPDKTYLIRKFREVAMWANIAITRNPDGTPRQ
jgi:hypothetical protein